MYTMTKRRVKELRQRDISAKRTRERGKKEGLLQCWMGKKIIKCDSGNTDQKKEENQGSGTDINRFSDLQNKAKDILQFPIYLTNITTKFQRFST